MIDNDGGISEWACLADDEKKELRKAKWAREIGSFFLPRTIFFACPPGISSFRNCNSLTSSHEKTYKNCKSEARSWRSTLCP